MPSTATATAETVQTWADLPAELLRSILDRLPSIVDSLRFAAVCTSWASARAPHMPYLLLPSGDHCHLLSLPDNRHARLGPVPPLLGKRLVGSQSGRLALVDKSSNPLLLNPLSLSRIPLPSTFAAGCYRESLSIAKIVTSPNPTAKSYQAVAILRSVLTSRLSDRMLFAKAGRDSTWFMHPLHAGQGPERIGITDAIYSRKDGKFLVLSEDGAVRGVDIRSVAGDRAPSVKLVGKAFGSSSDFEHRYVVESGGDLLQVCRSGGRVEVRRLEKGRWVPARKLGERSVFVGEQSYSVSLSVGEVEGLKPNRIYFASILEGKKEGGGGGCKVEFCDLEVGGSVDIFGSEGVWFTPP